MSTMSPPGFRSMAATRIAMSASLYLALALTKTTSRAPSARRIPFSACESATACRCSCRCSPARSSTISSRELSTASILKKGITIPVMASISRRSPQGSGEKGLNSRREWLAYVVRMPARPGKISFPPPPKPFMGWGETEPTPMRTSHRMNSRFTSTSFPKRSVPTLTRFS